MILLAIFIKSCVDLSQPANSESGDSWFGVGPPLVIGLGFLLMGAGADAVLARAAPGVLPAQAGGRRPAAARAYVITYARMTDHGSLAVGPRVKALREAGGLSLRDLAERSGVSAPMLSQVERGETSPTLQVAARIAAGLAAAALPAAAARRGRRGEHRARGRAPRTAAPTATATRS